MTDKLEHQVPHVSDGDFTRFRSTLYNNCILRCQLHLLSLVAGVESIMSATKAPAQAYSTTGTVSSPLDFSTIRARGEHESVSLPANGKAHSSKRVQPKPKVTLTSLTINNVGVPCT
jgi:hypothetical protein